VTHAKLRGYAIVQNIVPSDLNLAASRELTAWFRGMRKSFRLVLFFLLLSGAILSFRSTRNKLKPTETHYRLASPLTGRYRFR
jgi:hypothetical protein